MPLIKIGSTYYNGEERPIYLLQGTAVKDAEHAPVNGHDHTKVSIAAIQNENGDTLFVNVNGWRGRAAEVALVRKGDSILTIGALKSREYNGRNYYDLDADFICVSGAGLMEIPSAAELPSFVPAGAPVSVPFEDLDDSGGELPF